MRVKESIKTTVETVAARFDSIALGISLLGFVPIITSVLQDPSEFSTEGLAGVIEKAAGHIVPGIILLCLGAALAIARRFRFIGAGWLSAAIWCIPILVARSELILSGFGPLNWLMGSRLVSQPDLPSAFRNIAIDIVLVSLFGVVVHFLQRSRSEARLGRALSVGGSWHPINAALVGVFLLTLFNSNNPLVHLIANPIEVSWLDTVGLHMVYLTGGLYLWKTSAHLFLSERGLRLSVAGAALPLPVIRWNRIFAITEMFAGGKRVGLVIEHGRAPFTRFRFMLHEGRDGTAIIDAVRSEIANSSHLNVAHKSIRNVTIYGYIVLGLAAVLLIGQAYWSRYALTMLANLEGAGLIAQVPKAAMYGELGFMHSSGMLLLGIGAGILLGSSRGGFRAVDLIVTTVIANALSGPLLHWLVIVAITALLQARHVPLGDPFPPMEPLNWELAYLAMDVTAYAPCFVPVGYIIGVLIAVKSASLWFGSWPYKRKQVAKS